MEEAGLRNYLGFNQNLQKLEKKRIIIKKLLNHSLGALIL
jgi:hypothetical protein